LFLGLRLDGVPEIAVFAHAVAVPTDINDVAMMHVPVDQGRRHDFTAQNVDPFLEAFVRGQDRRGMFVARIDQLKNRTAPSRRRRAAAR
jgi:hypothetical protein